MNNGKTKYELADVIKRFGNRLVSQHCLSPQQTKALLNIVRCRTADLGGHKEVCDCCGMVRYSYNSCGDRHCPKCQNIKQALWVDNLIQTTLEVKHFHIVFTVPHCLNQLCLWNDKTYYSILFRSVWNTLRSFGYTHYGCETGAVAVLHTWGQNLSLHPHIHCLVPAAGYSLQGQWKNIGNDGKYLYPVHQLSAAFKGKFLDSMKRFLRKEKKLCQFESQIEKAYKTKWVVHSEPALTKGEHVVKYLGQYTHRVAISNQRIIKIDDTHVTFWTKDYRDNATRKVCKLRGEEFLRRFCQHVMPARFVRIRRYGIYNPITKRNLALQFKPKEKLTVDTLLQPDKKETSRERVIRLTGFDPGQCPYCKKGRMVVVEEIPRIRSPSENLNTLLQKHLY